MLRGTQKKEHGLLREVSAGSMEYLRGEEENMNDYVQDNLCLFND
jgi:hypothetical protein